MKELSLHILDIVQNSIKANASLIELQINENNAKNILEITIIDNGCGMDEETVKNVTNPFFTTRTTRKIGLGLPLLEEAALRCNGNFKITSEINVGTTVYCSFEKNNIDRSPIGDMATTIMTLLNSIENWELIYIHTVDDKRFDFSTVKIKEILDGASINSPEILLWIKEYVAESVQDLYNTNE